MTGTFSSTKEDAIRKRLQNLLTEYEAASEQLGRSPDISSHLRLGRNVSYLESEIKGLQEELASLLDRSHSIESQLSDIPTTDDVYKRISDIIQKYNRTTFGADEKRELRRLEQAVRNRLGRFALFFAISNSVLERTEISQFLSKSISEVTFFDIDLSTDSSILEQLSNVPGTTEPIIVYGIEKLLPSSEIRRARRESTLFELQLQRELFKKLNRPIIIWMPEYVYTLIGQQAVDFWSWQSESFSFVKRDPYPEDQAPVDNITNLPRSTSSFVGRENEIRQIASLIRQGLNVLIIGIGGSGKTETALKVAEVLRPDFPDGQIIVRFDDTVSDLERTNQALRFAIQIISPGRNVTNEREILTAIYRELIETKKVLVILDDVEKQDDLSPFVFGKESKILATSRRAFQAPNTKAVFIDTLTVEESAQLLLKIVPNIAPQHAEKLSALVGYLPLTIQLVAGQLRSSPKVDINQYAKELECALETDANIHSQDSIQQTSLDRAISFTYEILTLGARELLTSLSAFVAPFDIQAINSVGNTEDDRYLQELLGYSFVSFSEETNLYQIHPYISNYVCRQESSQSIFSAKKRHADFYLTLLAEASHQIAHHMGSPEIIQLALNQIERNWANIKAGQEWASENHKHQDEISRLCIDYSRYGYYFIENTRTPELRIKWYQSSLESSKELGLLEEEIIQIIALGRTYRKTGEIEKALSLLTEAIQIANQLDDLQSQAVIRSDLSDTYFELGNIDYALKYVKESLELFERVGDASGKSLALYKMARAYLTRGEYDQALMLLQKSLQLKEQVGDTAGKSATLNAMAQIFQTRGDLEKAIDLYRDSLQSDEEAGNVRGVSTTLQNMAQVYYTRGELDEALGYLHRSMQIKEQIGDIKGKASILNAIGQIYQSRGELQRAISAYQESLQLDEQTGDVRGRSVSLNNLALSYASIGELDRASALFEDSLRIKEEVGDIQGISSTLHSMAQIYQMRGDLDRALSMYEESLKLDEQVGDIRGESITLRNMAEVYSLKRQFNQALSIYRASLIMSERIGDLQGKAFTLYNLANLYTEMNNLDLAENAHLEALALDETIGDIRGVAFNNVGLGQIAESRGEIQTALHRFQTGWALLKKIGSPEAKQVSALINRLEESDKISFPSPDNVSS